MATNETVITSSRDRETASLLEGILRQNREYSENELRAARLAMDDNTILLPPKGREVWIDDPAFAACPLLKHSVETVGCATAFRRANREKSKSLRRTEDWLNGRIPIPEKAMGMLLRLRENTAELHGFATPLPCIRETQQDRADSLARTLAEAHSA